LNAIEILSEHLPAWKQQTSGSFRIKQESLDVTPRVGRLAGMSATEEEWLRNDMKASIEAKLGK
jgi:hypothetical protein